jgi:putative ABC transport system permease protein
VIWWRLAIRSLVFRWQASLLTVISMALSVALYCSVESLRKGVHETFEQTVSQTDLIVGARSSPLNIILYTLFHMGDATNNLRYETFKKISSHPVVRWSIPFSLGDSHRGFRVMATNESFYEFFQFRGNWHIEFSSGTLAKDVFDVVLGSEVAARLNYKLNDSVVIAHGMSSEKGAFSEHSDKPFRVVGVLKRTGTPVDRALFITLEGMEAIHINWKDGSADESTTPKAITKDQIKVTQITSFLLGLKSRVAVLHMQRMIQNYADESLEAAIPGFVLSRFWESLGAFERTLSLMTLAIFIVGLIGMLIALLTSLDQRRREMAVLRALGSRAYQIFILLLSEAYFLMASAIVAGLGFYSLLFFLLRDFVESKYGVVLVLWPFDIENLYILLGLFVAGTIAALIPAAVAYLRSVSDGLQQRT